MTERVFVIERATSGIFTDHLEVSKCETPYGLSGPWKITDSGWVSVAKDLGKIVGKDVARGDICVFRFDRFVCEVDRQKFREGLFEVLTNKDLTRI
ncbi:MAG TPA: hypothetical protein VLE44_02605 [Candidatus Saccharimonadales bacterium]|nr:hypothetical protein [Candidatus Saccharimonadales bacterium]